MKDQNSDLKKSDKRNAPRTRIIALAIAVGIAVLCFAIGVPTREDKKIGMRDLSTLVMPFNFAHDKFSEFQYFTETIQQKWGTSPEDLLKLDEYNDPDDYGHSAYAIEDTGLIVEFYYFENRLYQSTINMKDSAEAKKWVEYLENKFEETKNDGKFSYWEKDQLRIVYAADSDIYRFYFVDVKTFVAAQEYRQSVDSNQARLIKFKQAVENNINWNTNPQSMANISLYEKKELYQWDIYTHTKVKGLDYHFFQNRLCGIDFIVRDSKQAENMIGIIKRRFGRGINEGKGATKWEVNGVTIISKPIPAATVRFLLFRHRETWAEKVKFEKKYALSVQ